MSIGFFMSKQINIVASGGGRFYVALAAAIKRLLEHGYAIRGAGGVSAGSIATAAYACHREGKGDLERLVMETLPGSAVPLDRRTFGFWRFPPGWYSGNNLLRALERSYKSTLGEARIPLAICTTDLATRTQRIWTSWQDEQAPTARVVRASMAVPGLFDPVMLQGHMHVDGGLVSNFPIDEMNFPTRDFYGNPLPTVGLQIIHPPREPHNPRSHKEYLSHMVSAVINSNEMEDIRDAGSGGKIIPILVQGPGLDIHVNPSDARAMWKMGTEAVDKWVCATSI